MRWWLLVYLWASLCITLTLDHQYRTGPDRKEHRGSLFFATVMFAALWPLLIPIFWLLTGKARRPV